MSIDISVSERVATILLNRPDKLNALTDTMWMQLRDHLDRCEQDDEIRSVIITGAGRGFCAGADISGEGKVIERKPGIAGITQMTDFYFSIVRRIYHMPKPTVAAVKGAAVGISWTMALCCDFVLAGESAKFRPGFMNLGKVPEGGFQFLLSRLVGEFKARELTYRSQFVTGPAAAEMGLVTRCVADDELIDEANTLAAEAAGFAPAAFKYAKRLFNSNSGDYDAFLAEEAKAIAITATMSDAKEGMMAFVEKRAANFTGT
ncbi:MAG: enoyl-CoA hydratase-related protein [Novosphingobium sp.]|nr:enoyl-CoA hydratase-related protein [Novosphingobium sp.]